MTDFLHRIINDRLERQMHKRIDQYTKAYATRPDGSVDEAKAGHITLELTRRFEMGKELDIYEPLRWTAMSGALSVASGLGMKAFEGKPVAPALKMLMITTGITSAIQAVRFIPRFNAGLKGGKDVALAMAALDADAKDSPEKRVLWSETVMPPTLAGHAR